MDYIQNHKNIFFNKNDTPILISEKDNQLQSENAKILIFIHLYHSSQKDHLFEIEIIRYLFFFYVLLIH